VNLTWQAPALDGASSITGYKVYRGTSASTESFLEKIGPILFYNDTGLTNNVTYYYQVTALNSFGEGPRSNEASAEPSGTSGSGLSVQISADPDSGAAPLKVSFTCSVTGGVGPYAYLWNFSDGGTSSLQNPTHTFDSAGTHNVSLRITDSAGNGAQKNIDIEVTDGGGGSSQSLPMVAAGIIGVVVAVITVIYLLRWRGRKPTAGDTPKS
jgi:PKD repeat protein